MARLNLIYNPSFRQGLAGWEVVSGASIEVSAARAFYGVDSLKVTKSALAGSGVTTANFINVEPSKAYAVSAYTAVDLGTPSADLVLKVTWYTSSNTIISENVSTTVVVDPTDGFFRLTGVYVAPGSAAKAKVSVIEPSSGSAGTYFYVDAVMFEQSSFVGGFIDNLSQAAENAIVNRGLSRVPPSHIGGMDLNADITIGDLVLNTIDEAGTLWVCTDIGGWWVQADPEIPDIPRGVEDGSYEVTGRYAARQLVLSGVMIPSSSDNLGAARNRLVEATNLVRRGAWLRTNEEPTRAAYVRLSGRPQIETVNARGKTVFSIGLRAADPIKYEWNDSDPDGYTTVDITGSSGGGMVVNKGTADVTGIFTLTGPLGLNSTIYNEATDETITIVQPLRGSNAVAAVTNSELYNNIATLTASAPHNLRIGDVITVSGVGAPFDSVNETFLVTAASDQIPYTVSYDRVAIDRPYVVATGAVGLANSDILEIDTYDRSVKFNGESVGHRSKVETLVDWIRFTPGINNLVLDDSIDESVVIKKAMIDGIATLTTMDAHFLDGGDTVTVALPETLELKRKSITSNVATLTTEEAHGYSVGDLVDVNSIEVSEVVAKERASGVVTLTTAEDGGFSAGDSVTVELATFAIPATKAVAANTVTITTVEDHEFSTGDSVTVAFPTSATVSRKAATTAQATITTVASHGYSVGDTVTVALPVTATITNKTVTGNSVTLATSPAHGFAVNDSITVALPTTATLTGTRSMAGSPTYLATLDTTAAHNFVVGDTVTVDIGVASAATVSNRSSSGTTRTLTTSSAHGFRVGERITVTGVSSNYNASAVIASVPTTTTLTYEMSSSVSESSTASSGSITNNTIATGYNGTKVIEAVTSTSFSFLSYADGTASSGGSVAANTVTNTSNTYINGTYTIAAVPNSTTFQYTKA
jgi:hypothetical protein